MIIIENPLKLKYKFVLFDINSKTIKEFQTMERARFLRNSKVQELKTMIINANHFDSPIIINDVNSKKRIIDGQHRISAIRNILEENNDFSIQVVLVVYQNLSNMEEKEIFTRWNSGTRQTGEDIIQIYTDEIAIYDLLKEHFCIYNEPNKIKFRNIVQPYLMAIEENPLCYMTPINFIEKAKKLGKEDANKINSFVQELKNNTKNDITFKKATGQYALTYIYFTKKEKCFWEKFNKIKKYKQITDAGEQSGRVAVSNLINLLKNKMFGEPMPMSPLKVQDIFSEDKINWMRKNFEKTTWDRDYLTQEFNEKYKTKFSAGTISYYLKKNQITKDKKFMQVGRPSPYTKEVKDYMREISKTMIVTEARKACELKFQHQFSPVSFGQNAKKEGISFAHSKAEIEMLELDPKILKVIKKYKNLKDYEIRDKIIEEFEKDLPSSVIHQYLRQIGADSMSKKEIKSTLKEMGYDDEDEEIYE